jgi:hypothetical protein
MDALGDQVVVGTTQQTKPFCGSQFIPALKLKKNQSTVGRPSAQVVLSGPVRAESRIHWLPKMALFVECSDLRVKDLNARKFPS